MRPVGVLLATVLLAACVSAGPFPLIRDGGNFFSPGAERQAEARLRAVGARVGVWFFILTDDAPDPPRLLDEPMADAAALRADAYAMILGPEGYSATGYSRQDLSTTFNPPSHADVLLREGRGDEALDVLVRHLEAWSRIPDS